MGNLPWVIRRRGDFGGAAGTTILSDGKLESWKKNYLCVIGYA